MVEMVHQIITSWLGFTIVSFCFIESIVTATFVLCIHVLIYAIHILLAIYVDKFIFDNRNSM